MVWAVLLPAALVLPPLVLAEDRDAAVRSELGVTVVVVLAAAVLCAGPGSW
ncbi:MAG TPA: hypothetical protein VIX86_14700 [Streptosporangiaceae bacterium]